MLIAILTLIGSFSLLGGKDGIAQTLLTPNNEVMAPKDGLTRYSLTEFEAHLAAQKDKPTLLFFYASWCPHCRVQLPQMLELEQRRAQDFDILYVSIDREPDALAAYLKAEHKDDSYTPYILAEGEGVQFARYLGARNSQFRGGVPYTAVFQPDGRLSHEFRGRAPIEEIEKAL